METDDVSKKKAKDAEIDRIHELRERLYARGNGSTQSVRHALPSHEIHDEVFSPDEASQSTSTSASAPRTPEPKVEPVTTSCTTADSEEGSVLYNNSVATIRRKSLRKKIALLGVVFFVIALGVSSFFMFSGTNTISGDNISLEVSGPLTVGGGEEFPFRVTIANQNTVAIQSASLIIEYPKGTQSATEADKEIYIERKQLDTIGTGELLNIELKARLFGEENEEKEIKVSIDYRIAGSNATFHKEASPLILKVSTSPVVMTFDTLKTISSGQEMELKLTVQSNSPTPLENILIKAEYPEGFDFSESDPETVSGEDTWKIALLKPSEKKVITIKGLVTGYEDEKRRFTATAGVANATNKNTLTSTLAQAQTEVAIEQPFLDVNVLINGSSADTVVVSTHETETIEIEYKNVLDTAIYDGKVLVELDGNALNEFKVSENGGFYDSTKNTLTWDSAGEDSLKEILPGRSSRLSFSIEPKGDVGKAPEVTLKVTVKGQRVFEDRASQELVGVAERTIKIASVPTMESSAYYSGGPFMNTGPVPPVAEVTTQYTFTLKVETDTNDVTGAEVTAVIPQYVSWLDLVTEGDDVIYNPTTRIMKWTIGDMEANSEEEVSMQVSFLPSLSQVNTSPTLLEAQRFKATDRFTGTVIRADHPALTTSLLNESDEDLRDGRIRATE